MCYKSSLKGTVAQGKVFELSLWEDRIGSKDMSDMIFLLSLCHFNLAQM